MPLLAIIEWKFGLKLTSLIRAWILTTHCRRGGISFDYLWVHINQHVLVHRYSTVAFLDLLFDPHSKRIFDHRIHHIDQPLFGNFLDLYSIRQVLKDILMFINDFNQVIHLQSIVLWYCQVLNGIRFNDYKNNSDLKIMSCLLTLLSSTH